MKQRIRINESQLKRIVTESVKRVLNEAFPNGSVRSGFDKWTTVNRPCGGASLYSVELGEGLHGDLYYAFAYDEQEALDAVVDYLEKKGFTGLFYDNEEIAQEYPDDFITAGNHCHLLRADGVAIHKIRDGR